MSKKNHDLELHALKMKIESLEKQLERKLERSDFVAGSGLTISGDTLQRVITLTMSEQPPSDLGDLADVTLTAEAEGNVLRLGATDWENAQLGIADTSGLQAALDGKSDTGHTHAQADVTGLVTDLAGKSDTGHGHSISDTTGLQTALDGKSDTSHTHAGYASSTHNHDADYADISHTHPQSDVTGLVSDLAGKASTSHNHDGVYAVDGHSHTVNDIDAAGSSPGQAIVSNGSKWAAGNLPIANVTNLQTELDGKSDTSHNHTGVYAPDSHSHAISDVTNLQTTLDGKAASSHNHAASNITSGTLAEARGGVPTGGTTGQVLKKTSNTSNDVEWADESGGGSSITELNDIPDVDAPNPGHTEVLAWVGSVINKWQPYDIGQLVTNLRAFYRNANSQTVNTTFSDIVWSAAAPTNLAGSVVDSGGSSTTVARVNAAGIYTVTAMVSVSGASSATLELQWMQGTTVLCKTYTPRSYGSTSITGHISEFYFFATTGTDYKLQARVTSGSDTLVANGTHLHVKCWYTF